MSRPWIKQHKRILDDARLAQCSDAAQRDYLFLYQLAGVLDAEGAFIEHGRQLSEDEIAFKLRIKAARLKASMNEMKRARLIHVNGKGPQITDYQAEQQSWRKKQDADRERQQRHRSVTRDSEGVTPLERESESRLRIESLLLLSPAQKEKVLSHPEWVTEALKIAETKKKTRPDYVAGILKNFILEKPKGQSHAHPVGKSNPKRADKPGRQTPHAPKKPISEAAKRVLAKRGDSHV